MRYIQHPVTHELIPADQYERPTSSWQVMKDIDPYVSQIDGSVITSRSKHRAHLKQHGCIEVGNDSSIKNPVYKSPPPPPGLKSEIIRAVEQYTRK